MMTRPWLTGIALTINLSNLRRRKNKLLDRHRTITMAIVTTTRVGTTLTRIRIHTHTPQQTMFSGTQAQGTRMIITVTVMTTKPAIIHIRILRQITHTRLFQ